MGKGASRAAGPCSPLEGEGGNRGLRQPAIAFGLCPGQEADFIQDATAGRGGKLGDETVHQVGRETPLRFFWELNRASPLTQHGAPALLAKPA